MLKLQGRAILPIWAFAFGVNLVQSESMISVPEMGKPKQETSQEIAPETPQEETPKKEQPSLFYHKKEVEIQPIPYEVKYEFHPEIKKGQVKKIKDGKNGEIRLTWLSVYKKNKLISKEIILSERKDPVNALFHMGTYGYRASRGSFNRKNIMTMHATAYDTSPRSNGGYSTTRTGMALGYGVVAVDPKVIPLKSLVYVEGYGFAIAADTGGAIKGKRIDLCYPSRAMTKKFGRRNVRVHILQKH